MRATHYHARWMRDPPRWARGKAPCATIGQHLFFNDID
jgi:spore germination cell wall hydrolase CwlJ-like protein